MAPRFDRRASQLFYSVSIRGGDAAAAAAPFIAVILFLVDGLGGIGDARRRGRRALRRRVLFFFFPAATKAGAVGRPGPPENAADHPVGRRATTGMGTHLDYRFRYMK